MALTGTPDPNEIRALERELKAVREERLAAQRQVAERGAVEISLQRTSRDRSALSSPTVEALRDRVQELFDQLVASWDGVDRARLMGGRLRRGAPAIDIKPLLAALDAEADGRLMLARRAAEGEVDLEVPPPYELGLLTPKERASRAQRDGSADGEG